MLRWTILFAGLAAVAQAQPARPRVALALGGGAARGLAHVGVLRWLEEHHVPIDGIAGTSMGGLIGGAYAAGMSPDDIEALLGEIDWDAAFGSSGFRFEHVRRKRDFRALTSRLEFGLKNGIAGPPALNAGQQVGLWLARIAAPFPALASFDDLPTPFRCVAADLRTATPVVLHDGSLARAMRATMAIPLTFPPVVIDDRVLVDGGALDNLPSKVARSIGADKVIAVNVANLARKNRLDYTLLGLVAETMDAMIRANEAAGLAAADVAITVPLPGVGATSWNRLHDIVRAGYDAAESMKAALLPLAVGDVEWNEWRDARRQKRPALPRIAFVHVEGAGAAAKARIERRFAAFDGAALDIKAIERELNDLGLLDRYETLSWELATENGERGLLVRASPKANGPPFLSLGVALENTTSNEFRFGVGARLLFFDVGGSGTELRVDMQLGSEPGLSTAWHRPIATTRFFVEPYAAARTDRVSIIEDGRITGEYGHRRIGGGVDVGVNPGRETEVRIGIEAAISDATVRLGDPTLPDYSGHDTIVHAVMTHDTQDDPLLPSQGSHVIASVGHFLAAPEPPQTIDRDSLGVTLGEFSFSWARPVSRDRERRMIAFGGAGAAVNGRPLVIDQFSLGGPARMTAFGLDEARGDRFAYGGVAYLHRAFRLPDFLGRSVFLGGWVESGAAFDRGVDPQLTAHASVSIIADTLIGPLFAGASAGVRGESRFYLGIGRMFP